MTDSFQQLQISELYKNSKTHPSQLSPSLESSSSSSSSSFVLPPRPPPKPPRLYSYSPSSHTLSSEEPNVVFSDESSCNELDDKEFKYENKSEKDKISYDLDNFDDFFDDDEDVGRGFTLRLNSLTAGNTEKYLFGLDLPPSSLPFTPVNIKETQSGFWWENETTQLKCIIQSVSMETKYKGVKCFTLYQIYTSALKSTVHRRFKHFLWLYSQFLEKFPVILVPLLPNKQISGRFQEDFIEKRKKKLEKWLDFVCKHPVLSSSDAFRLFITSSCLEEWKQGKRRVEKDKFKGAFFFCTVKTPLSSFDPISIEVDLDKFERFVRCMEDSLKHLFTVCNKFNKFIQSQLSQEFKDLGLNFEKLSSSFDMIASNPVEKNLSYAISYSGKTFKQVSLLHAVQSNKGFNNFIENILYYKKHLSLFPDILLVQRSSMIKIQENAGNFGKNELREVQRKVDTMSFSTLAETNHFQENRVTDFKYAFKSILSSQINFYDQICDQLSKSLELFTI